MTTVRRAKPGDLDDVRRIATAAFGGYVPRIGRMPAPAVADHASRLGTTWVVEHEGGVAGYCVLAPHDDHLELDTVAVDPACTGRGLGRALVRFAEQEAAGRGLTEVRLCTNAQMTENQTLYPYLGYTETGRRRDAGFERVFYAKRLG